MISAEKPRERNQRQPSPRASVLTRKNRRTSPDFSRTRSYILKKKKRERNSARIPSCTACKTSHPMHTYAHTHRRQHRHADPMRVDELWHTWSSEQRRRILFCFLNNAYPLLRRPKLFSFSYVFHHPVRPPLFTHIYLLSLYYYFFFLSLYGERGGGRCERRKARTLSPPSSACCYTYCRTPEAYIFYYITRPICTAHTMFYTYIYICYTLLLYTYYLPRIYIYTHTNTHYATRRAHTFITHTLYTVYNCYIYVYSYIYMYTHQLHTHIYYIIVLYVSEKERDR